MSLVTALYNIGTGNRNWEPASSFHPGTGNQPVPNSGTAATLAVRNNLTYTTGKAWDKEIFYGAKKDQTSEKHLAINH